jgi:hypothetical protein
MWNDENMRDSFCYVLSFMIFLIETDGKAGMAAILNNSSTPIDINPLVHELKKYGLPSYARPCFIRVTQHIELTG